MSGIDIRSAVTEWRACLPLWIDKVYQFTPKGVAVRLNGKDHARYHLLVEAGNRAHFSSRLPSPPKMPPSFAMLLRKYLSGGKVLDIRQTGIQRIITIDIGKKDLTYHLILELFDDGNIILCEEDYTIIKPLTHHRFREREVVPGVVYVYPPDDPTTLPREKFGEFLKHEDRDIVRTLAIGAMLGGMYAEYVCRMTATAKETPSADADADIIYDALHDLLFRAESEISPFVTGDTCQPFPLDDKVSDSDFQDFNAALDSFYPVLSPEEKKERKTGPKLSKQEFIRKQQEDAIRKFEKKIEHNEKIVEKIYENYGLVQEIITTLSEASKTRSWQEIQEILKTQKSGPAQKIKAINPAESAVDVDLGQMVTLYVQESPDANAGRYYDQIKKFRKKIAGAKAAMERAVSVKTVKSQPVPVAKKKWFHRFRWFYTSDGVLVLGGRDAQQNEELVKKYLEGGDRFVHADVHGASVIIVKGETARMDEVAIFAASYSGAWRSGHFSADVYSVSPDQVSKTPESGEYISRGSFVIRGGRSYQRDVPLEIAIGLMQTPHLEVIGGPPSAITGRAGYWVILKPGRFEPNDIAKKVLRVLKEKIPEKEQKGLKNILNTEQVAAFVPPGGSDIEGDYES